MQKNDPRSSMTRDSTPGNYFLVTAHRAGNVDVTARLAGIINGPSSVDRIFGIPVVFPMHLRTRKMMQGFGIAAEGITFIKKRKYTTSIKK